MFDVIDLLLISAAQVQIFIFFFTHILTSGVDLVCFYLIPHITWLYVTWFVSTSRVFPAFCCCNKSFNYGFIALQTESLHKVIVVADWRVFVSAGTGVLLQQEVQLSHTQQTETVCLHWTLSEHVSVSMML